MANERREERLFDVRLRNRHLDANRITQDDVEKYLKKLPDTAENMEVSEVRLENNSGFTPEM